MDVQFIRKIKLGGFLILVVSLFYYQIIRGDYFLDKARSNYIKTIPLLPIRGSILDRNRTLLAFDVPTFNIAVVPYQIRKRKDTIFRRISQVLSYPQDAILKNYQRNLRSMFAPVEIIHDLNKDVALRLKEKFKSDIQLLISPQRYYPYPYQFSHILGYVKRAQFFYKDIKGYGYLPEERVGFLGIEQYYDSYLRGEGGGDLVEVNSQGKLVGFLGRKKSQRGKDIYLTIDARMQIIAYESLKGYRGVIIMLDPYKGEIFVLCSRPSFNLNSFIKGRNIGKVFKSKDRPMVNRGIQETYPLGSVFKPIVGLAGLEEKVIDGSTTFYCDGEFTIGDTTFRCWSKHFQEDIFAALAHSCNVYFYNLGVKLGVEKIHKWAKKFGFGSLTGIDLPYEKKGLVPSPVWKVKSKGERWFLGDTVNLSIGQGYLEVSPLQAVVAISCFANGGYLVTPHLLKKVDDLKSVFLTKHFLNVSKDNLMIIKKGLRKVVADREGTANKLELLGLEIAGKTGTAQNRGSPHGWFVGFFPYQKPQYSVGVFLENCGESSEAVNVLYYFLKRLKEEGLLWGN